MGTNFYLQNKYNKIHIAKTSAGWKPLFQACELFDSVKQLNLIWNNSDYKIVDSYNNEYTWNEFKERVLYFGEEGKTHIGLHSMYFKDGQNYEWTYQEFS